MLIIFMNNNLVSGNCGNYFQKLNIKKRELFCDIDRQRNQPSGSLAETPKSAGMLRYFAQICLQIFTSFPQIYDVQRS